MGRRKHCTQEQREVIKKLLNEGKTFEFIRDLLTTYAFKIIKEKIIQCCFKTFMGRIEFKFVLLLYYPTPLYIIMQEFKRF